MRGTSEAPFGQIWRFHRADRGKNGAAGEALQRVAHSGSDQGICSSSCVAYTTYALAPRESNEVQEARLFPGQNSDDQTDKWRSSAIVGCVVHRRRVDPDGELHPLDALRTACMHCTLLTVFRRPLAAPTSTALLIQSIADASKEHIGEVLRCQSHPRRLFRIALTSGLTVGSPGRRNDIEPEILLKSGYEVVGVVSIAKKEHTKSKFEVLVN